MVVVVVLLAMVAVVGVVVSVVVVFSNIGKLFCALWKLGMLACKTSTFVGRRRPRRNFLASLSKSLNLLCV